MIDIGALFAEDGPLAAAIPGFRHRESQVALARAIADAIDRRGVLIAEAGTGTGKTFAYLVPVLAMGGKAIISTGTKTLQDQLFGRDLPTVRKALGVPVTVALLKGRANYVCHYHLARASTEGRFVERADVGYLRSIERYARTSQSGDRGGLADVPETASVWSAVTSTRDNCLGSDCPDFKECFVMKARKQALEADVVVVNHHLFFADVVLRDEGVGELLPHCNTVVLDEAHQLPDTASVFFGDSVSTSQIIELARDSRLEGVAAAKDFAPLPESSRRLDRLARDLRLAFEGEGARLPVAAALAKPAVEKVLDELLHAVTDLSSLLESQAERSEGLERCHERSIELVARLHRWAREPDPDVVRWVEVFGGSVQLHATPLSVGSIFRRQVEGGARAWILTSATLSVKGEFSHYAAQIGLEDAQAASWPSPFDYERQAILYVPEDMPSPNSPGYTKAVIDAALPLIEASGGRTFCLFTSLRAMREAHGLLEAGLQRRGLPFPLLLQGDGTRTELLDRFRRVGNGVLVGSQSFWEGVDVRGPTLSLVVIDRLPFTPPDGPVLTARIERINAAGGNAFMEYQVPQAAILLKQGAGRLIRDESDRGVLMICDPRLVEKPYGRRIWQSLPPMRRTRIVRDAVEFLAALSTGDRPLPDSAEDRDADERGDQNPEAHDQAGAE